VIASPGRLVQNAKGKHGPGLLLVTAIALGCGGTSTASPVVPGGDAARGRRALLVYNCVSCHVIPGTPVPGGLIAAPLTDWAKRRYIAGALVNTPDNLIRWIVSPDAIEPGTKMPTLGVSVGEARDMAAYLYTVGEEEVLGPPHPLPLRWLHALMPGGGGEPGGQSR
jgi:cytochrome c2